MNAYQHSPDNLYITKTRGYLRVLINFSLGIVGNRRRVKEIEEAVSFHLQQTATELVSEHLS